MGRVFWYLLGFEFCFQLLLSPTLLAAGGTEVGNGAIAQPINYELPTEGPVRWTCFFHYQNWSVPNTYVSPEHDHRSQAENEAHDACVTAHSEQPERCFLSGCTFSAR